MSKAPVKRLDTSPDVIPEVSPAARDVKHDVSPGVASDLHPEPDVLPEVTPAEPDVPHDEVREDHAPASPIPHSRGCKRPAPILRRSWRGEPELACPACGRYAPAPDTRTREDHQ